MMLAVGSLSVLIAGVSQFDRGQVYRTLAGHWSGSLTYKDYRDPNRRITLPTLLDISFERDSAALRLVFTYDDGPGKTEYSYDRLAFDAGGTIMTWDDTAAAKPQAFSVKEYRVEPTAEVIYLVAETEGEDDNKPATLRETITIARDSMRILKTVRPRDGEFGFRHEYAFRRVH
jgi:hypothetical protein